MSSEHIIEVSEAEFQNEVLAFSGQIPVVVDFWAEWCIPCRTLGPILEKLAEDADGAFRLAKVNVDDSPRLANQYQISSLPSVKAFQSGQVVDEFLGVRPEPEVRLFLRSLAPNPSDLTLEKGHSLYLESHWEAASSAFRQVLEANPDQGEALLGLAKSELAQGNAAAALVVLREFPASKQYAAAKRLLPLAEVMAALALDELEISLEDSLDTAYVHSLRLIAKGNPPAAVDGMLEIMREDKGYRNGENYQTLLSAIEMLDHEDDQTRQYRTELASLLF